LIDDSEVIQILQGLDQVNWHFKWTIDWFYKIVILFL
jgi:hypothetical protein